MTARTTAATGRGHNWVRTVSRTADNTFRTGAKNPCFNPVERIRSRQIRSAQEDSRTRPRSVHPRMPDPTLARMRGAVRQFGSASIAPTADGSTDQALRNSDVAALHAVLLSRLTTLQLQAMLLTYYGGHTNLQASALLGIPLATLKSRVLDALVALRQSHPGYEPTRS